MNEMTKAHLRNSLRRLEGSRVQCKEAHREAMGTIESATSEASTAMNEMHNLDAMIKDITALLDGNQS